MGMSRLRATQSFSATASAAQAALQHSSDTVLAGVTAACAGNGLTLRAEQIQACHLALAILLPAGVCRDGQQANLRRPSGGGVTGTYAWGRAPRGPSGSSSSPWSSGSPGPRSGLGTAPLALIRHGGRSGKGKENLRALQY